jgi:hypothetical protein
MTPIIRPLSRGDVDEFHPGGLPFATRGFALVDGDHVLAIAGVMYSAPALQAFSAMRPEAKRYPVMIMKVARKLAMVMDSLDAPIFAIADTQYSTSEKFLERIGFSRYRGRMYQWT